MTLDIGINVVSSELIKPSSPTPLHLKTHKLSLLDQLAPPIFTTVVLFYKCSSNNNGRDDSDICISRLKESLSDALMRYYPLAGRLVDGDDIVDCNDEGALFVEARVIGTTRLDEILENPRMDVLQRFAPRPCVASKGDVPLLAVHYNRFVCGGVGIKVRVAHKVMDGASLATFLRSWSASATLSRHGYETITPLMDSALHFPAKKIDFRMAMPASANSEVKKTERYVTKRLLFGAERLTLLRQRTSVTDVTRVEAVTSLIWKCLMAEQSKNVSSVVAHTVNLRAKMDPPLPDHAFGNLVHIAVSHMVNPGAGAELPDLVSGLRQEIQKIDGEFVSQLQKGEKLETKLESIRQMMELESKGEFKVYWFSSWCRFPFYESDFGFGEPIWACPTNWPMKNVVCLLDTKSENGVEAWVTLTESDMKRFECNQELQEFLSLTPK